MKTIDPIGYFVPISKYNKRIHFGNYFFIKIYFVNIQKQLQINL